MTTETFRRADHRPVPTSAHEAEASCCFPLDITHSPSRRRLSKEIVGRGTAQRALVVLLPPLLILCHEGQIVLTVPPMIAIFLIGALRDDSLFRLRSLAPLVASISLSLALTFYFLINGIPTVEREVLSEYFASKSPYNTGERSWLLYDNLEANFSIAMGRGREFRQLVASPLYILAFILHLPVIALFHRLYKGRSNQRLRLACRLVALTVAAQCVIFFLSIDYARHIANIFLAFVVMLFFLVQRFELSDAVAVHTARYRHVLIGLAFILAPIPKFGIISP